MITEAIATVADYAAGLGLEASKEHIQDKIDEKKLRTALSVYIERQPKYNEFCTLAEEIDFQGLVEYISDNLLEDAGTRIFHPNKKERKCAREDVIAKAVAHSKADTPEGKKRVSTGVAICLDIIRGFYKTQFTKKDYLLAAEIVDAVTEGVDNVVKTAADDAVSAITKHQDDIARDSVNVLTQRIDEIPGMLLETMDRGKLFSVDRAISLAENGNLSDIQEGITSLLEHISLEHPHKPYYRYEFNNGKLLSKPVNEEAKKIYPPKFVLTGAVRFGNQYYNDANGNPLDYAYRHQVSFVMEVKKAVKLLGSRKDPTQAEMDGLEGNTVVITPPEFPPAFPCAIKVGDKVFFDYVLLRTQEILDDGTYVISNKEQDSHLYFDVKINPDNPSKPDFKIKAVDASNKLYLNYARFMDALSKEKDLHIYVLSMGVDIIAGTINDMNYPTGFASMDEEIDFLERICSIEEYFQKTLNIDGNISNHDYKTVIQISDLIRNEEVSKTWEETSFKGVMDQNFRDKLLSMDDELFTFSYVGVAHAELFGTELEFHFMRTFRSGKLKDIDKIKRKAEILDDGDDIKITFCSGEDKTVIDTLKIPEKMNQE